VTQGIGPEFKLQYWQKQNKTVESEQRKRQEEKGRG
jgi:hypothetical protein